MSGPCFPLSANPSPPHRPRPVLSDPGATAMPAYPTVDASADRLKRAGWSAGDVAVHVPAGVVWLVTASRGGQQVEGRGTSQAEAWHRACVRAEAFGLGQW
jgi:hypothetical protein